MVRSVAEDDRERAEATCRQEDQTAQDEVRRQAAAATARRTNQALLVLARWLPDKKPVLSGLSPTSAGNGKRRGSVNHVRLLDNLDTGRLHRAPVRVPGQQPGEVR